ncbi:MAG: pirin family protein [Hyphomicrobiaceae bacterium]
MLASLDPEMHLIRAHGAFRLRRMHPGAMLGNAADKGFGGLGLIDHAQLTPPHVVALHEHRNDEIVSYLRRGKMIHIDTAGNTEEICPDRLMVMNAGAGLSHEEQVAGIEDIDMLQIFVRPEHADLPPGVQFHDLAVARYGGNWRLLAGFNGSGAPTVVRQRLLLSDQFLPAGDSATVSIRDGFDSWLYVFNGQVTVGENGYTRGDAIAATDGDGIPKLRAVTDADLVLFEVDRNAPFSRAGTLSRR